MDRLTTMVTFLSVIKHSNFSTAADELSISRTLASRHVAALETYLGLKLLNRTTRSVTPTEAGLRYSELCQRVLGEIREGEEQIAAIKNEVEGEISILCPIWLGSFGISLATSEFCALNPKVSIKLQFEELSANPHDFLAQGFDLAIQPNTLRDSSIMVKKIGQIDSVLVASREYLDAKGEPRTVADLEGHRCLAKTNETSWSFVNGDRITLRVPSPYASNSVFALRDAAFIGLGIAMLPKDLPRESMASGELVEVLSNFPIAARPLYVAYPPGGDAPRKTRALISFLADWFQQRKSPDRG